MCAAPDPSAAPASGRRVRVPSALFLLGTARTSETTPPARCLLLGAAAPKKLLGDDTPPVLEDLPALVHEKLGPGGVKLFLGLLAEMEEGLPARGEALFVLDLNRWLDRTGLARARRVQGRDLHAERHLAEAQRLLAFLASASVEEERLGGGRRGRISRSRLLAEESRLTDWEALAVPDAPGKSETKARARRFTSRELVSLRLCVPLIEAAPQATPAMRAEWLGWLRGLAQENALSQGTLLAFAARLPAAFARQAEHTLAGTARDFARYVGLDPAEAAPETAERMERALALLALRGFLARFETSRYRVEKTSRARDLEAAARPLPKGADTLAEPWRIDAPAVLRHLMEPALPIELEAPLEVSDEPTLPGIELDGAPPHTGEMLREIRKKLGFSQLELARALALTQAAISMAESGKRPRMAQQILDAARRLDPRNEGP